MGSRGQERTCGSPVASPQPLSSRASLSEGGPGVGLCAPPCRNLLPLLHLQTFPLGCPRVTSNSTAQTNLLVPRPPPAPPHPTHLPRWLRGSCSGRPHPCPVLPSLSRTTSMVRREEGLLPGVSGAASPHSHSPLPSQARPPSTDPRLCLPLHSSPHTSRQWPRADLMQQPGPGSLSTPLSQGKPDLARLRLFCQCVPTHSL